MTEEADVGEVGYLLLQVGIGIESVQSQISVLMAKAGDFTTQEDLEKAALMLVEVVALIDKHVYRKVESKQDKSDLGRESNDAIKRFNNALLSSGGYAKDYTDAFKCCVVKKVT